MTDTLEKFGVGIKHHFSAGVYAKETFIAAGVELSQHTHPHDHMSILASGTARITAGDRSWVAIGPECLNIKAGVPHKVAALTGVVWFCVHATDETDPEKVDTSILTGSK